MAGGFGFKVSLIKAFQPHLLVFYGVIAGFGNFLTQIMHLYRGISS
jgi:hypothetical protein